MYQKLIAPNDDVKMLLNPIKVFCYGCFKVVTLSKTLSSIEYYVQATCSGEGSCARSVWGVFPSTV